MSTNIAVRHKQILEKLKENGSVSVSELADIFNVSAVTIRKDLKLLESKTLLFRSHGKALPTNPYVVEQSVTEKEKIHTSEKSRIATAGGQTL
jgi:DeoR family transcriptional regulator of aga operon